MRFLMVPSLSQLTGHPSPQNETAIYVTRKARRYAFVNNFLP